MDDSKQPNKQADYTGDFKDQLLETTKLAAAQAALYAEFWKTWIPGGMRKRKRYRTKGHGLRKAQRRKHTKAARRARRKNRR